MKDITLSPDQKTAMDIAITKVKMKEQCVTIGGYAGTGKTTITGEIIKVLRPDFPRIAFACFTGKAKNVLEKKLMASGALIEGDFCGTIHQLIFDARRRIILDREENTIEVKASFEKKTSREKFDLIVIDEASMVNRYLYDNIAEFKTPILAIGDHAQLPPIGADDFSLMKDPMIRLEKIHRQAENNPIVKLSMMARIDGYVPCENYGEGVIKTDNGNLIDSISDLDNWTVLTGTNWRRTKFNSWFRKKKYGTVIEGPIVGDRVVCLRNNHAKRVFNGMQGIIKNITPEGDHWYMAEIQMDGFVYIGKIFKHQFMNEKTLTKNKGFEKVHPDDFEDLWDYGYALSYWKAQGSEFQNVIMIEERFQTMSDDVWRRCLYTGITRAREKLIIIGR